MEKVLQILNGYRHEGTYHYGYIDGYEEYEDFLEKYRQVTGMYFPTEHSRSRSSDGGSHFSELRPMFNLKGNIAIDFCGVPFTAEGTSVKSCMFGKDTKATAKEKKKNSDMQASTLNEHQYHQASQVKKKPRHQVTKKKDCPAKLICKEVRMYPQFSIDTNKFILASDRIKRSMKQEKLDQLNVELKEGKVVENYHRFYLKLPSAAAHENHEIGNLGDLLCQPIHEKVKEKIYELVSEGMVNPRIVRLTLKDYVQLVLLRDEDITVDQCNTTYYPELQTIADHIRLALRVQRYGKLDQAALAELVEKWKGDPNRFVHFRPQTETIEDSPFLFVHQEQWQKRLLNLYGQKIVFLDATHKTMKYALPLFFLAVETNAGYVPVAEFIVYHENKESIMEALKILKGWNPGWNPPYGMTDYDDAEISAFEETFPGIIVYICGFHREQAWTRWVRKSENRLSLIEQKAFLSCLRLIAVAKSEVELKKRMAELEATNLWKSKQHLRNYATTQWLKCVQRWVQCYRNPMSDRCVNTNNGVESLNKVLKYNYLKFYCDKSATGLVSMLINTFLLDRFKLYVKINHKMTDQHWKYSKFVEPYLHDRPIKFVKHMEDRKIKGEAIPKSDIMITPAPGKYLSRFLVKSQLDPTDVYAVDLNTPMCECHDFARTNWPCKHMHSIFLNYPESGWHALHEDYKNRIFLSFSI